MFLIMTRLGFKFENIKLAFDIYNFDTIDKAISILTRDPETNLFNHKFDLIGIIFNLNGQIFKIIRHQIILLVKNSF